MLDPSKVMESITVKLNQNMIPDQIQRLEQQIEFMIEIDKLKQISRKTILTDRSREENSAEHSWHITMAVFLFSEYAQDQEIDWYRVIKMLLVHDLDRFQPFLQNYVTEDQIWRENNITRHQVMERMQPVFDGAPLLWNLVKLFIDDAVQKKYLAG